MTNESPTEQFPLLSDTEAPVPEKGKERHASSSFRKTNEAIGLRVASGKLGLLGRKIFNALVFNAQQLGKPGVHDPIGSDVSNQYYWVKLTDVVKCINYDSRDIALLKRQLEELQSIRVVKEDGREWTSEHLIASVKISKAGANTWLGFTFPPEVSSLVMQPSTYTKLSLYYQTILRTGPGIALYEICRRYATSPSKLTAANDWEWWYGALSGAPQSEGVPEYKYFKRDTLKPAISEINTLTDIKVELIEIRHGRKVAKLQFLIELKSAALVEVPQPSVIDGETILKLISYGFSQREATNMTVEYELNYLKSAIAVMDARLNSPGGASIEFKTAYFKQILKNGNFPLLEEQKPEAPPSPPPAKPRESLKDRFLAYRARNAFAYYLEISAAEQQTYFDEFKSSPEFASKAVFIKDWVNSPVGQHDFGMWLADKLYGEASAEDVLRFAESQI